MKRSAALVLVILSLAVLSCTTSPDSMPKEQESVISASLVTSQDYLVDHTPLEPWSKRSVDAEPIAGSTVRKFPHLIRFRGAILLGNENLHVILYGIPSEAPKHGSQPLVIAAFLRRSSGWHQLRSFGRLVYAARVSGQDVPYVPVNLDVISDPDSGNTTVRYLLQARGRRELTRALNLTIQAQQAVVTISENNVDDGAGGVDWQMSVNHQSGAFRTEQGGFLNASGAEVWGVLPGSPVIQQQSQSSVSFASEEGKLVPFSVFFGAGAGSWVVSQRESGCALLSGCDEDGVESVQVVLGGSSNPYAWHERSASLSVTTDFPPIPVFAGKGKTGRIYVPKSVVGKTKPATIKLAESSLPPMKAEGGMVKVPTVAPTAVDLVISDPPALLLFAPDASGFEKVHAVAGGGDFLKLSPNVYFLNDGTGFYSAKRQALNVWRIDGTETAKPCFPSGFVSEAANENGYLSRTCEIKKSEHLVTLAVEPGPIARHFVESVGVTKNDSRQMVRLSGYGSELSIWLPSESLQSAFTTQRETSDLQAMRRAVDLSRSLSTTSLIELGCPDEAASARDYLSMVELLKPDAVRLVGCVTGHEQEDLLNLYNDIAQSSRAKPTPSLTVATDPYWLEQNGVLPVLVSAKTAAKLETSTLREQLQSGSLVPFMGVVIKRFAADLLRSRTVGQKVLQTGGAQFNRVEVGLDFELQAMSSITIQKIRLVFPSGASVSRPIAKRVAILKAENLVIQAETDAKDNMVRLEVYGQSSFSKSVSPDRQVLLAASSWLPLERRR